MGKHPNHDDELSRNDHRTNEGKRSQTLSNYVIKCAVLGASEDETCERRTIPWLLLESDIEIGIVKQSVK